MLKQMQDKRIGVLEGKLDTAIKVIDELLAALTCRDPEIRQLTKETAEFYMKSLREFQKSELD